MKFPCNNCLLIPLCRHKDFLSIMKSCSTICTLLYDNHFPDSRCRKHDWCSNLEKLEATLNPTTWVLKKDTHWAEKNDTYEVCVKLRIQPT